VQALKALWPRQKDQGSLAQRHYDALDVDGDADGIQVYAVRSIAQIMCRIVTGREVQAERDGNNAGSEDEAPPVLPADVVKPRPAIIVKDVLQLYASTTRDSGRMKRSTRSNSSIAPYATPTARRMLERRLSTRTNSSLHSNFSRFDRRALRASATIFWRLGDHIRQYDHGRIGFSIFKWE
jgi:hypothetical protein